MALYALDTTIFSRLMREDSRVLGRLEALPQEDRVVLCSVVRGEILYGLARLPDGRRKRELAGKAESLFAAIPCEGVPPGAAGHYARIKREAEEKGTPLDENDLWIAAAALDSRATLVAADTDFQRVHGLPVEDWSA